MRKGEQYFCDGRHGGGWDDDEGYLNGDVPAPYFRECGYCGDEIHLCLACRDRIFLCARCFENQRAYGNARARKMAAARTRRRTWTRRRRIALAFKAGPQLRLWTFEKEIGL